MITINPVKLNTPKHISFKEGNLNNITPGVGILSLQNPNAGIRFEKDFKLTQRADAVQANPITALGYKLYKTFKIIFDPSNTSDEVKNFQRENLSLIG